MNGERKDRQAPPREAQSDQIARSARRKLKARKQRESNPLYGLGMFGLVGWAVAIPTLIGTAIGLWIDAQTASARSWTLVCLLGGVALGCLNAWYWVSRESRDE